MQTVETAKAYHERTKHHPDRYAASLGYMDWATQPDPFRRFEGAALIPLPMPQRSDVLTYSELFNAPEARPLNKETLSSLLRYSLGLAAIKCIGDDCWALRCNASSGNLHPTEGYVILPPITGITAKSCIAHYAPKAHTLEIIHTFDFDGWTGLPPGSFFVAITSVVWREAWKYGERAFRYTQLDAGHALQSVHIAARLSGWHAEMVDGISFETLLKLTGTDQPERFLEHEEEIPDLLMALTPDMTKNAAQTAELMTQQLRGTFEGIANLLSPAHHPWEAITLVERATGEALAPLPRLHTDFKSTSDASAEAIILSRRSARGMDPRRTTISHHDFMQMLRACAYAAIPFVPATSLTIFVHDVETLDPGLYLYLLNPDYLQAFKSTMRPAYLFKEVSTGLFLLEKADFRMQAKHISCSQDIASDGAFSLGMLCEFTDQLERFGASRYKSLYWECGAIGQQLYLEATSLGLDATGIGCFLDDVMHRLLGLSDARFQSLYHFTVGRAILDVRLQTFNPYAAR